MKKLITIFILILSLTAIKELYAQPYLAIGLQNKGFNMGAGFLASNIDLNVNYKTSFISADEASILSSTVGYQVLLSKDDKDNYSFTPSIGAAFVRVKDFSKYDIDPNSAIEQKDLFKPTYGIELAKDSYLGRIALNIKYVDKFYYGITMRVFFYR